MEKLYRKGGVAGAGGEPNMPKINEFQGEGWVPEKIYTPSYTRTLCETTGCLCLAIDSIGQGKMTVRWIFCKQARSMVRFHGSDTKNSGE